jgi:hypothetical protein
MEIEHENEQNKFDKGPRERYGATDKEIRTWRELRYSERINEEYN